MHGFLESSQSHNSIFLLFRRFDYLRNFYLICKMKQYLIIWITCILITFCSTIYIKSVASNNILFAMISDLIVPFLAVFYYHFLIEEETLIGKIKLSFVCGSAYSLGTGIILYLSL